MIRKKLYRVKLLFRSIPSTVLIMYVLSLVAMNLLANKSIDTGVSWLALDCGIIVSWAAFLAMDIIVKRFGSKASITVSVVATLFALVMCLIFFIASIIPGVWGESFVEQSSAVNLALNNTFGGTWFVIFGSVVASLVASVVNAVLNVIVAKLCGKCSEKQEFYIRSWVSTMIAQFIDNLTFALIVSINFFGWSLLQCVTCALTGAIMELLFEIVFSPAGYRISKQWAKDNVGSDYFKEIDNV